MISSNIVGCVKDLWAGLAMWRLWLHLGWMDVVRRYRRTTIGPFWTTLSVGVFIGVSGFMYAGVFKQDLSSYLPYISTGFAVWVPLSTYLNECASAFTGAESTVKQTRVPYFVFIMAGIVRNAIVFAHHLVIYVVVVLYVGFEAKLEMLLAVPAILAYVVNAAWAGIVVAVIGARFRDMQQVVANLLVAVFFMTPIFWPADSVRGQAQAVLVDLNVFHHFVDIVRAPMLGKAPEMVSWYVVILATIVGWTFALWLYDRSRSRIVFWI